MSNLNLLGLQDECKTAIVSPLLTWKQNDKWYLRRPGSAIEHAVRQHPRTAKYEGATWPQRLRAETSRSSMPEGFSFALAHSWPKPTEEAGRMQLTARSIRPVGRGRRHSLGTVPCTERAAAAPVGANGPKHRPSSFQVLFHSAACTGGLVLAFRRRRDAPIAIEDR